MRSLFLIPLLASLFLFCQSGFAQSPEQLNAGKNQTQNSQLKSNKSKGKPLVKKEKVPRKKLFGKKANEKVPAGYTFDNRETAPKKLTDNPNAKQMLPKNQKKRLDSMKKKKIKSHTSSKK